MTKSDAYHFGQLIYQVHFTAMQRRQILHALPFMSESKCQSLYEQLKTIHAEEQAIEAEVTKMKAEHRKK